MSSWNRSESPSGLPRQPSGLARRFRMAASSLARFERLLPLSAAGRRATPARDAVGSSSTARAAGEPATSSVRGRSAEHAARVNPPESELYPAFVKLHGRRALVVGGGPVALQKTLELLRAGADVTVVARQWPADFSALIGERRLRRETRAFAPSDLEGAFLVVAATDDAEVQREIWKGAESRGILCNVVDVPDLCNYYVPASLRRGALTVSVSTAGKSPLLAVALRDRLARLLARDLGPALEILAAARALVRSRYPDDHAKRRAALGRLLSPDAIDTLMEGNLEAFEAHERAWTTSLSD